MAPAVAAAEAIASLDPQRFRPQIKWVNDVFLESRKVSGVLTGTVSAGGWIERVVFGIGINVAEAPVIHPTPFVPAAGCLAGVDPLLRDGLPRLAGQVVARLDAMVQLLRDARTREVVDRYRGAAGFIGREVRIWPEGIEDWERTHPAHVGRVTAMFPDGSLAVSGSPEPVRSGRLAYEEHCLALGLPPSARATASGQGAPVG
jgi:BirA family biotin operon repressor/biotin-[acetyl-CoA-carboxylase] ligase